VPFSFQGFIVGMLLKGGRDFGGIFNLGDFGEFWGILGIFGNFGNLDF
jgi:hypothetical protein